MAALLIECAARAALVAASTAVVLWALRIRTASVRHAAWTAVVIAMLLLPLWLIDGPRVSLPVLRPTPAAIGTARPGPGNVVPEVTGQLETIQTAVATGEAARPVAWQDVIPVVYLLGAFILLIRLAIGTVQANRLRRHAVNESGRATSGRCATPITVGWFRPVLILPSGWSRWPVAQLDAVLTHEQAHARRHDPLVQWLALLNRAIFWFHPLAWWLERRVATLAEEACDAAVLAAGHSPQDYSAYLIDLARAVTREGRRIHIVGTAMPGSGLRPRLRQILDGMPMPPISRTRAVCTVAFCAMSSVLCAATALAPRPAAGPGQASKSAAASGPRFDVVSIKPCKDEPPPTESTAPRGRIGGGGKVNTSPGRLTIQCMNTEELVYLAYASARGSRLLNNAQAEPRAFDAKRIRGGPAWVYSEKFAIEASAAGVSDNAALTGPMLQSLLEDRFQLKTHRDVEQRPMYALTVASGGLKIKPNGPDGCLVASAAKPASEIMAAFRKGGPPPCGFMQFGNSGTNRTVDIGNIKLRDFAELILSTLVMDRRVLDKTGIDAAFNIHLQFAPDESTPGSGDSNGEGVRSGGAAAAPDPGPSIFKALEEQLGLKLEPTKGPSEFIIIDHVARPTPDGPLVVAPPAAASMAWAAKPRPSR